MSVCFSIDMVGIKYDVLKTFIGLRLLSRTLCFEQRQKCLVPRLLDRVLRREVCRANNYECYLLKLHIIFGGFLILNYGTFFIFAEYSFFHAYIIVYRTPCYEIVHQTYDKEGFWVIKTKF